MSALGHKLTSRLPCLGSALPLKADVGIAATDVGSRPEADFQSDPTRRRLWPRADLAQLLLRQIGFARLTPTQATDPHAGRARLLRYLRRARCEPLLWRVSVAHPRHFRAAQATGQPA
jgi:hypothetical protein